MLPGSFFPWLEQSMCGYIEIDLKPHQLHMQFDEGEIAYQFSSTAWNVITLLLVKIQTKLSILLFRKTESLNRLLRHGGLIAQTPMKVYM